MNHQNHSIAVVLRVAAAATLMIGCAARPQVAVNPRADFSHIDRVAVAAFSGPGGEAAADMFTQDLLALGADVIERQRLEAIIREHRLNSSGNIDTATIKKVGKILGVDAVFLGTILANTPSQSYLVNTGGPGTVNLTTVTPVGGPTVYSRGAALGVPGSEVVTTAANVGLIARLVDVESGSILWSARMTYEGLDTESAMSGVTASFANSLVPLWPGLHSLR